MRVYLRHARQVAYCSLGIRQFCKTYGIDFLKFVREGISAEQLKEIGDPLGLRLIEIAQQEINGK